MCDWMGRRKVDGGRGGSFGCRKDGGTGVTMVKNRCYDGEASREKVREASPPHSTSPLSPQLACQGFASLTQQITHLTQTEGKSVSYSVCLLQSVETYVCIFFVFPRSLQLTALRESLPNQ
eukprot:GHVN01044454.1.p4 GENE.GHVN01044454.1~~GHVN01044454.1.p4  ORF type:complete len:121 (-),score=34.57 GHVN01044454.1:1785-2147(-)